MNEVKVAVMAAILFLAGCASSQSGAVRYAYDRSRVEPEQAALITVASPLFIASIDDFSGCGEPMFCKAITAVAVLPGKHHLQIKYNDGRYFMEKEINVVAEPGMKHSISYEIQEMKIKFDVEKTALASGEI